ncbi:MAG TPA: type II and III secretion system protein family protein [Lacipirellulaceae bacterium]|nr:type II and III secretion system protein family protein [Lacipirellulaceae bacterium]
MSRASRFFSTDFSWAAASAAIAVLLLLSFGNEPLYAAGREASAAPVPDVRHIVVVLNKSRTIRFNRAIKTATIASTAIADVTPLTDRTLYIQGKKVGTTNISVFDEGMQLVEIVDLEVTIDTQNLQQKIRASTGDRRLRVSSSNGQVILTGVAADAVAADRAVSIAKSMVPAAAIVNAMSVAPSQQVMLKVRFLEASRAGERDLGVNWFGSNAAGTRGASSGLGIPVTGTAGGVSVIQSAGTLLSGAGGEPFGVVLANLVNGGTNIDVLVSALESKGLVRRLAEPNLVALSGDTARFLAGGEFPVPQISSTTSGAITPTFEFKKFGVSLAFVPTVLNDGLINLRIAPEVSELDFANAVTISGTKIPSLVTRNSQTTVELRDGQSFAIAGLFQDRDSRNISQLPWLGSVPVLGALFRSSAYQNSETDLVIIVTPHLVRPGTPVDRLATPLDQRLPSNDIDFFVNGQMEVPKKYSDYVTSGGDVQGPYGYIIPIEKGSNRPVYKGGIAQ